MLDPTHIYFCGVCGTGTMARHIESGLYQWEFWRCPAAPQQPAWMQGFRNTPLNFEKCIECVPSRWFNDVLHTTLNRLVNIELAVGEAQLAWRQKIAQRAGYTGTLRQHDDVR